MSVLIAGIQMPKNGWTDVRLHCDGSVTMPTGSHPYYRLLTAVEVSTPHGRLIDADAFSEEMRKRHKAASDWYDSVEDNEMLARAESTMMAFTECRMTLDAMQTVIEAEDGST